MNSAHSDIVAVIKEPTENLVKLPVDIRSLLIGFRSRYRLLLVFVAASLLLGGLGAKLLGKKSYEARTVLLYRPPATSTAASAGELDQADTPTLLTQMDMVKINDNLEEVRRRLNLKETAEKIGAGIKVDVPVNSSLMTITVTSDEAVKAAEIANTTRQVFLERQLGIQHAQASSEIRDLLARQDKVMTELHAAEQKLKEFTIQNHVVDLDKEAGWYLQQLINTELVYEEAVGQDNASKIQEENVGRLTANLERKMQAEEAQIDGDPLAAASPTSSSSAPSDAAIRGRVANLKMKQIDMDRAKTLSDDGIYSRRAYEQAKAAYEQERFLLYKDSPSASLYKEMTLRELDVQLGHISDQQKVAHLREAVAHVHERLDSLPLVQRDYLALQREVAIRAAEREHMDQLLGAARREDESQTYGFSVVSVASPPLLPLKSNRKLVFIALTVLGTAFGVVMVLLMELADRRLRSVGDARAKLAVPVLAGFNHGALETGSCTDDALTLVNRLRQVGVNAGSRVMVVSPTPGEGAPELIEVLARAFAAAGNSIVLTDAQFRNVAIGSSVETTYTGWRKRFHELLKHVKPQISLPPAKDCEPSLTALSGAESLPGLSDLLAGSEDAPHKKHLSERISLIPAGRVPSPELLLSNHLSGLLSESVSAQDLMFVGTAPLLEYPDATFLGSLISNAIIVAAAGKVTAEKIGSCADTLKEAGVNVLGIVVTNIASVFVESGAA